MSCLHVKVYDRQILNELGFCTSAKRNIYRNSFLLLLYTCDNRTLHGCIHTKISYGHRIKLFQLGGCIISNQVGLMLFRS